MNSQRYAKTQGAGSPFPGRTTVLLPSAPVCQFTDTRGRRCHMLTVSPDSELCPDHTRKRLQQQRRQHEAVAAELLGDISDFSTADAINVFLGNLVRQLAYKRITRRDAVSMAYICQLLLNSLPAVHRQLEAEKHEESTYTFLRNFQTNPTPTPPDTPPPADQHPTQPNEEPLQ